MSRRSWQSRHVDTVDQLSSLEGSDRRRLLFKPAILQENGLPVFFAELTCLLDRHTTTAVHLTLCVMPCA